MRSIFLAFCSTIFAQFPNNSAYRSMWANKDKSIFANVKSGRFEGNATGYIQIQRDKDTLLLDFHSTQLFLDVLEDKEEMYDNSTKKYSTQTSSGKTLLKY